MAANAGSAFLQIMPTFKGNAKTIADLMDGKKAGSLAGGDAGDGFAANFVKGIAQGIGQAAVKVVANATRMAVDGAKKLIAGSVQEFVEYEQQVGGIETMFGNASDTMLKYAKNAYKTAGISANDYMKQATSFSATLLQGLKGDTVKAAEYANKAMIDMSDNANKFGTTIGDIQHAYQGFAKQNYTMLDNLKLGYGGTKTEMQRLLADASKLPNAMGRKFDLSNYADVIEAIHLVQENLGVMGTTAEEAEKTISGSFGMMKAAASNLLAALGTLGTENEWDVSAAAKGLTDSFSSVIKNVGPAVASVAAQLPGLIKQLVTTFREELWPQLKEQGSKIITALMDGLIIAYPSLESKFNKIKNLFTGIKDHLAGFSFGNVFGELKETLTPVIAAFTPLGQILKGAAPALTEVGGAFKEIGITLGGAIKELLPTIATVFADLAKTVIPPLADALPTVAKAFKDLVTPLIDMVTPLLKNEKLVKGLILAFAGHAIIGKTTSALDGLGEPLTTLASKITGLGTEKAGALSGLRGGLTAVQTASSALWKSDEGLMNGWFGRFRDGFNDSRVAASKFSGFAGTLGGKMVPVVSGIKKATAATKLFTLSLLANPITWIVVGIVALVAGLVLFFTKTETGRKAWAKFTEFLSTSWVKIKEIAGKVVDFIIGIPDAIKGVWENIKTFFTNLWNGVKESVVSAFESVKEKVTDAFATVKEIVTNAFHRVVDPILTIWSNVWDTVKAVLAGVWLTIVALITGNGDQIKEIWGRVGDKIRDVWSGVLDKLAEIWERIKETFHNAVTGVKENLSNAWDSIKTTVSDKWNDIVEFVKSIPAKFMAGLNAISALATRISEWISQAKTAVVNKFTEIVNWIKGLPAMWWAGLQDLANLAVKFGGWVLDAKTAVVNKFNEIVDFVKTIPAKIVAALANLGSQLAQSGRDAMQGFLNGINEKISSITSAVSNVASKVTQTANNALQIHSPSRVFMRIGNYVSEGLALGIADGTVGVIRNTTKLASGIVDAITPAWTSLTAIPAIPEFGMVNNPAFASAHNPATSLEDVVGVLVSQIQKLENAIVQNSQAAATGQIRAEVRATGGMPTTRGRIW